MNDYHLQQQFYFCHHSHLFPLCIVCCPFVSAVLSRTSNRDEPFALTELLATGTAWL